MTTPVKTITAYKLFETKPGRPGEIFPLFISKDTSIPINEWVEAQFIPTAGYQHRPGWHAGLTPRADHLLMANGTMKGKLKPSRVWAEVEIQADVDWQPVADASRYGDIRDRIPEDGYYVFNVRARQGGTWIIGGRMKVVKTLTPQEVADIRGDSDLSHHYDLN